MNSREAVLFMIDAQAHILATNPATELLKDSNPYKRALQSISFELGRVIESAIREKAAELRGTTKTAIDTEIKEAVSLPVVLEPVKSTSMPAPLTEVGTNDAVAA